MYTKAQMPAMAARAFAILHHSRFYNGSRHFCGEFLRYTAGKNCVMCARKAARARYTPIAARRPADVSS